MELSLEKKISNLEFYIELNTKKLDKIYIELNELEGETEDMGERLEILYTQRDLLATLSNGAL